jgi:hypothetical protein
MSKSSAGIFLLSWIPMDLILQHFRNLVHSHSQEGHWHHRCER